MEKYSFQKVLISQESEEIFIEFSGTKDESSPSDNFEKSFIEAEFDSERNAEISEWDRINIDELYDTKRDISCQPRPCHQNRNWQKRPSVIVSSNVMNKHYSRVIVLPITSNISKIYPFEVFIDKNNSDIPQTSKIMVDQIRCVVEPMRLNSLACFSPDIGLSLTCVLGMEEKFFKVYK